MNYEPELAIERASLSRQAAAASRDLAGESHRMAEESRRKVVSTYRKIFDSTEFLHSTLSSFTRLTHFLLGGDEPGRRFHSQNAQEQQ